MSTSLSRTKEETQGRYHYFTIDLPLALIANGDLVTNLPLDFYGTVERLEVIVTDPVTTASDAATFNVEIGTTDVTGASVATTSDNMTPVGTILTGTATGANSFGPDDTLSIEASSVTTYAEGHACLRVVLKEKS